MLRDLHGKAKAYASFDFNNDVEVMAKYNQLAPQKPFSGQVLLFLSSATVINFDQGRYKQAIKYADLMGEYFENGQLEISLLLQAQRILSRRTLRVRLIKP